MASDDMSTYVEARHLGHPASSTRSSFNRMLLRVPHCLVLPLGSVLTVLVLLVVILPVYFTFVTTNAQQDQPIFWPTNTMDFADLDNLDQFNVALDLTDIQAESRTVQFLLDLSPGGTYEHDTDAGVLDLDGSTLTLKLGTTGLKLSSGDAVSDTSIELVTEDVVPLYNYPFDKYECVFDISVKVVNTTDPDNPVEYSEDIGLMVLGGEQGWETHITLAGRLDKNGAPTPGVTVTMRMQRSMSVRFFSMFIVILMWCISLCMFVIAVGFVLSDSNAMSYDVPALAVGLLFAIPFVRDVQPEVPVVGATIDVFGFFWNILLIACSTVMVLAALTVRYQRAQALALAGDVSGRRSDAGATSTAQGWSGKASSLGGVQGSHGAVVPVDGAPLQLHARPSAAAAGAAAAGATATAAIVRVAPSSLPPLPPLGARRPSEAV